MTQINNKLLALLQNNKIPTITHMLIVSEIFNLKQLEMEVMGVHLKIFTSICFSIFILFFPIEAARVFTKHGKRKRKIIKVKLLFS